MYEYVIIGLIILVITLWVMFLIQWKNTHRFVAKRPGNKHNSTKVYWTKTIIDDSGVEWWQSWPSKTVKVLAPPQDSRDFLPNGKLIATGILHDNDQVVWVKNSLGEKQKDAYMEVTSLLLTPAQRQALQNQYRKAEEDKVKKIGLAQMVLQLGPIAILAMAFMVVAVFAADGLKAYSDAVAQVGVVAEKQNELVQSTARLLQSVSVKDGGLQVVGSVPEQPTGEPLEVNS